MLIQWWAVGRGAGEGVPGGGNSMEGDSDGEGLKGVGAGAAEGVRRAQSRQDGEEGSRGHMQGSDLLRSACCNDAQCGQLVGACSGQDRLGQGRRGSREAGAAPGECSGSRGRAQEKWTILEMLTSYPSFLRGAVSGKPTQGRFSCTKASVHCFIDGN